MGIEQRNDQRSKRGSAPTDAIAGDLVSGRYRLKDVLGQGGMGTVYRAFDEGRSELVALKLLKSRDVRQQELFEREYQTLSKLAHPRVILVYDYGISEEGARYYSMELLVGGDLNKPAPLPWQTACAHVRDVCTSLALLHAQRLVHRDVNPRNVRMDLQGRAKLIDFGALTSFGSAQQVVGTPPCIAPEALHGSSLDGRTDLFSLGVVAYWSLTGSLPFAIRELADAERAWQSPPAAPSRHATDVPVALDELILSLLSIDPLGRPASAAEVIDQLDVITGTEDEFLHIAESHLESAPWVGRTAEQAQLELALSRAREGRGGTITIESERGGGTTRLLSELRVMGQLLGLRCITLRTPIDPYLQLLRGLLEVTPQEVRVAGVATALEPLWAALRENAELPPPLATVEAHVSIQHALAELVRQVAQTRPLLICVDDVQAWDAEHAGVLVALAFVAPQTSILLALGVRLNSAMAAVQQLRHMGSTLHLGRLDLSALEMLVHGAFGDAPHIARLAQWLFDLSQGHPGKVHDVLLQLVTRGVLRYAGSAWMIPAEIGDPLLLESSPEHVRAQLVALSSLARAQVCKLAVHHGTLAESLLLQLSSQTNGAELTRALRELAAAQLGQSTDDGYQVAREGVRAVVLDELREQERAALHRQLADALWDEGAFQAVITGHASEFATPTILKAIAAGHHQLMGGREKLGLKLLRAGAIELTVRGEGLIAATADLEASIARLRLRGYDRFQIAPLLAPLILAATYSDWRLSYRYGDELLSTMAEVSGLSWARRLAPYLGGKVSLFLSLALAYVLFQLSPHRRVTDGFRVLLLGLMGAGSAEIGLCSVLQDRERAEAISRVLAPLAHFPASHPVRWVHGFQLALRAQAAGAYAESRWRCVQALAAVRTERAKRLLPERARVQLEGGILLVLGQLDALCTDGRAPETLRATERLDSPARPQTFAASLAVYHGNRGEREPFVRALKQMDRLGAKSGSTWRNDLAMPRMMWSTHVMCEDVMSLRRCVQLLEPLSTEVPTVRRLRDIISACYLSERGMPQEALRRFESTFADSLDDPSVRALQERAAYVRILRKAGEPERARQIALQCMRRIGTAEAQFTLITFMLHAELSLAEAAVGNMEGAVTLSECLLREQARHDNPLLHSLAHALRAELALTSSDWLAFDEQAEKMHTWVRGTEHPALIGKWQRLVQRGQLAQSPLADEAPRVHALLSFDTVDTDVG